MVFLILPLLLTSGSALDGPDSSSLSLAFLATTTAATITAATTIVATPTIRTAPATEPTTIPAMAPPDKPPAAPPPPAPAPAPAPAMKAASGRPARAAPWAPGIIAADLTAKGAAATLPLSTAARNWKKTSQKCVSLRKNNHKNTYITSNRIRSNGRALYDYYERAGSWRFAFRLDSQQGGREKRKKTRKRTFFGTCSFASCIFSDCSSSNRSEERRV